MTKSLPPTLEATPTALQELGGEAPHVVTHGDVRRSMLMLALPALGEQMLNTLVGLVDTYLAGRISVAATAAIGLAAYISWLVSLLVMLVGTGTTALVARNVGAGTADEANRLANQSLTLSLVLGLFQIVLIYTIAPWVAAAQNMTGETYTVAVDYLRIDVIGYLPMSITLVGCAALRGAGDMRTPMLLFAVINGVNVVASYSLVYGVGPIPSLGVNGIVIGTVIARTTGGLLIAWLLLRGQSGLRVRLGWMRVHAQRMWRILRIGLPAGADGAAMWVGHFCFLMIIARLKPEVLSEVYYAAHIVGIRVEALTYLPAMAWSAAAATMVGQALGAKDERRARRSGHEAVLQCGLLSVGIATFYFTCAEWIFQVMHKEPMVWAAGVQPFRILAVLQPLLVVAIVYIGALRGAGDTRFPLIITLFGTLVIRLSLAYTFGVVLELGLLGAWMGMFADMIWRSLLAAWRYRTGRWAQVRV